MGKFFENGNWFIDYRVNGRRKREKIGPNKKLAEKVLAKRLADIAENKYLDVRRNAKIKFEVFAKEYLELHSKVNNKSWPTECRLINVLNKYFSGKYLQEITPHLLEKFKSDRMQEVRITPNGKKKILRPATINRHLACLKSMFNKAIAWGEFIGPNPVKAVKFFKENNQRLRFLEKEEIVLLLSVCKGYLHTAVIIALNTGMRRGEILGLKWKDIDLDRGIMYLTNTKNKENREVPMNEYVRKALVSTKRHRNSEYIFYKKDGSAIKDIKKTFLTAMQKTGIKDFHFHDLRHTFASHLVMGGVDLNTVRDLLGHKSLQMTLRYSHLSSSHKQEAVNILKQRMDTFLTIEPPQTNLPKQ